MTNTAKSLTKIALLTSIICVVSPFALPISSVPITLASLIIFIISGIFKPKITTFSVLAYVFIGIVGVPVFSSFTGGFHVIFGASGGYILAYPIVAFLISYLTTKFNGKIIYPISFILGTLVLYAFGTIWYMVILKTNLYASLTICVVPFLIIDAIKIIIASIILITLNKTLKTL